MKKSVLKPPLDIGHSVLDIGYSAPFKWSEAFRKRRSRARTLPLFSATPWLSTVLILGALYVAHDRMAVTPGVMFDLPPAPLTEGTHAGAATVLMFSVSRETLTGEETLVFFDDERYLIRDDDQFALLTSRITDTAALGRTQEMILLADKNVPHGDVMRFVNLARQAGITRINVAQKPE